MAIFVTIILNLILLSESTVQQSLSDPLKLTRINDTIVIDGHVNEPVWDTISPLPLISYDPVAGLPPTEPTEIRIAYDDNYIYASIRAFDSNPAGIRSNTLYRDRLTGDDVFHILLDTYNDNESALGFTITPSGAKRDATISNDGEGPRALNADFMTYWDVATHIDDRGWFAEVRIPFSSLGFQDDNGRVEMGLLVQRGISRKNERVIFPEISPNISRPFFKPSVAHKIVFDGIYSSRPLHITPYLLGGFEQNAVMNETENGFTTVDNNTFNAGFDVKYGISNNLTLDLTVNTDFAQVEADDQQVNLTRFNLFFPEKRQFFQERSGIFEFQTGNNNRLFNSRRIGLSNSGEQVQILGGGRLTGKAGSWDIGILSMQTEQTDNLASENFGVVRLRRSVINPYSYIGTMGTSRMNTDGSYNIGIGLDGTIRFRNSEYISFVWAHTLDDTIDNTTLFSGSNILLTAEDRSRQGFGYVTTLSLAGNDFTPQTGFVARKNYYQVAQELRYGWLPGGNSSILLHTLKTGGAFFWSKTEHHLESAEISTDWNVTTRQGAQFNTSVNWNCENLPIAFPLLGRTIIPPGEYQFLRMIASYQMAASNLLRTRIELDGGTFYGGQRYTLNISPTWNLSKHLELEASYLYNLVDAGETEDWFTAHIGQLRVRTALNTKLSTNAFIQFNSSADIISTNVRFRYNFRDGNDFWIVYNEGLNVNRDRFQPVLPRAQTRTILAKYTHTFHY